MISGEYNFRRRVGADPKVSRLQELSDVDIDTACQCQLGRRIASPAIATFELAHCFWTEEEFLFHPLSVGEGLVRAQRTEINLSRKG